MKKFLPILALCICVKAVASGGDDPFNPFVPQFEPRHPAVEYLSGTLGIFAPDYHRRYLIAAYRLLSGKPLVDHEIKAFLSKEKEDWQVRLDADKAWLSAREEVLHTKGPFWINTTFTGRNDAREKGKEPEYANYYLNCPMSAFETAVQTLARYQKHGDSALTRVWLDAQDQVFRGCSEVTAIPTALPATAPKFARQDREYQIASALFYGQKFEEAEQRFLAIANDADSPWSNLGRYLAGRAALRVNSLAKDQDKAKKAAARAEKHFKAVLADQRLSRWHNSAKGLLRLMEFRRLDLQQQNERMQLWAEWFAAGEPASADVGEDLREFERLMDQALDSYHDTGNWDLSTKPLLDWVSIFQCASGSLNSSRESSKSPRGDINSCLVHATDRWNATHNDVWAVAVMELTHANMSSTAPLPAPLVKQVAAWKPSHPGYAFAQFHLILDAYQTMARMKAGTAERAAARENIRIELDRLLSLGSNVFPTDSQFLLQNLRVTLAQNLQDFKANMFYSKDPKAPADNVVLTAWPALDVGLSSAVLWELAQEFKGEKEKIHESIEAIAIGRTVALGNHVKAKAMIRDVLARYPGFERFFAPYLKAESTTALHDESIMLLATQPSLAFKVTDFFSGWQELITAPDKMSPEDRDGLRTWWWTGGVKGGHWYMNAGNDSGRLSLYSDTVMEESAKRFGGSSTDKEVATLTALGDPTNYLGRYFLKYAKTHPNDLRVPFVMHYLVSSTRGGSGTEGDPLDPTISRKLFVTLHKVYPKDKWTLATRYYY